MCSGHLLFKSICGELERADRGRGVVDKDLRGAVNSDLQNRKAPHVDVFRIGIDFRRSRANGIQRGQIEDQRPDICARNFLRQRVFRELEPCKIRLHPGQVEAEKKHTFLCYIR
jgi:hypothetical protein